MSARTPAPELFERVAGPTLASVLRRGHLEFGELPAVVDLVSAAIAPYAELAERARCPVMGLQWLGATKGDRIVVLAKDRGESFVHGGEHQPFLAGREAFVPGIRRAEDVVAAAGRFRMASEATH